MRRAVTAVAFTSLAALIGCGDDPSSSDDALGMGTEARDLPETEGVAPPPSSQDAPGEVAPMDGRQGSRSEPHSGGMLGRAPDSATPERVPSAELPQPATEPPVGALEPIIPEPSGPCPDFSSGSQRILGLNTEIVAGNPGAVKGPLLFTWHGTGGTGRQALLQLPRSVQDEIVAEGGIIVAPSDNGQVRQGADVTVVLGVWYDGSDLAYADHVVACAVQNHNVDPRRIYVTGCSAGGLMAGVMSLARSSYVAAAAPNSGGIAVPGYRLQDSSRVPAVMTMHGGANDNVIVNFGTTSSNLNGAITSQGGFAVDCEHGIGHCGAPASLHERAWEFMLSHPFGTKPSPYAAGLPADYPAFCEIR